MSRIGSPSARIGTAIAINVGLFWVPAPRRDAEASTNPRNMLPESPMKIFAGLKL